jgi:hypothetical protein
MPSSIIIATPHHNHTFDLSYYLYTFPGAISRSLLFNMKYLAITLILSALSAIGMAQSGPCVNQYAARELPDKR